MLVRISLQGTRYELRLSDGKLLTKFDNLGDARNASAMGPERFQCAADFLMNGLYYAR